MFVLHYLLTAFSVLVINIATKKLSSFSQSFMFSQAPRLQFWVEHEGYFSLSRFSDYDGYLKTSAGLKNMKEVIANSDKSWRLNLSMLDKQLRAHFIVNKDSGGILFVRLFGKHLYQLHFILSDCEITVRVRNLRHPTTDEIVHKLDGVKSGILLGKYINKIFFP